MMKDDQTAFETALFARAAEIEVLLRQILDAPLLSGEIARPHALAMSANGSPQGASWEYAGAISCKASGQYGFAVRVLPKHTDLGNPFEPGLVTWGS